MSTPQCATPVLFLIFNRPDLTRRVWEEIRRAQPGQLFVAADGPRPGFEDDILLCKSARQIVEQIDWPCELKVLFRDENLGCKRAVSSAITWFFEHVDQGIILEDDCLPDPSFFPFCTEILDRYKDDERILCVSGDNFQKGYYVPDSSYYFSVFTHIWGWATWKRAWAKYDGQITDWPTIKKGTLLRSLLGSEKSAKYWSNHFDAAYEGRVDSWAYPWTLSCWKNQGLTVLPSVNLVENIGFDGRATHTTNMEPAERHPVIVPMSFPLAHPGEVAVQRDADEHTLRAFFGVPADSGDSIPVTLLRKIQPIVSRSAHFARKLLRPPSEEEQEALRLEAMPRHELTETTLLGRKIQIVDGWTYIAGLDEIFKKRMYYFRASTPEPVILDCGANIGLAVIFFKTTYPRSLVTAFEPDPAIFKVLEHNIRQFGFNGVTLRNEALWTEDGVVNFFQEGAYSGRIPKGEGDAGKLIEVKASSLKSLIMDQEVDLLKIDIEGVESEVILDLKDHLYPSKVKNIFIEYHSHVSEPQRLHEILGVLATHGYRYHVHEAYARPQPFINRDTLLGMDLQLNIYAY